MPHQTFPEDSILKRHFESTVEMKRQRWLQLPPTDSILYRHTTMSIKSQSKPASTNAMNSNREKPHISQTSTLHQPVQVKSTEKGFLAKFLSLFSRNA